MRQGAASTGKLGATFRGNRGFLLTREAPAHGRAQTMPKGFVKHAFRRRLTTLKTPATQQMPLSVFSSKAQRAGKRIVFRALWKLT